MHHWTVHAKVELKTFPADDRCGGSIPQLLILYPGMHSNFFFNLRGVHSTTFDPELRNKRFTLIFVMGFFCKIKHITAISNLHFL